MFHKDSRQIINQKVGTDSTRHLGEEIGHYFGQWRFHVWGWTLLYKTQARQCHNAKQVNGIMVFGTKVWDSLEQSTRFCSERETSFPVALKCCPSRDPVVLNAQQEPH